MKKIKYFIYLFFLINLSFLFGCHSSQDEKVVRHSPKLTLKDSFTLKGKKNLLDDYKPMDEKGNINVVVEIPTGTNEKWEVDKKDGSLKWEVNDGSPRIVKYLSYPVNYGMVPQTILSKKIGGDGDPLDAIILGPAYPQGSVVKAKVIGVLKMMDRGEKDDKLVAIAKNTPLEKIDSIEELNEKYNGITKIIETWFSNYKGPNKTSTNGFENKSKAMEILNQSIQDYKTE